MIKGTVAKEEVLNKIKQAFGADFIGENDKKIYVWADDGGERVQIALSMTCPKVPIEVINTKTLSYNTGHDFENTDNVIVNSAPKELTEKEKDVLRTMLDRVGIAWPQDAE